MESRLSGLTQLLDANVTEEEKVLDALDDLLHILGIEVLNRENLDQTLLFGCEFSRRNDRRHCQCLSSGASLPSLAS